MIKTLNAIKGLNICKEIKDNGTFVNAVIGIDRSIKINVYSKFYTIIVTNDKAKEINKTFNHNCNLVSSILEMQKLASLYM